MSNLSTSQPQKPTPTTYILELNAIELAAIRLALEEAIAKRRAMDNNFDFEGSEVAAAYESALEATERWELR